MKKYIDWLQLYIVIQSLGSTPSRLGSSTALASLAGSPSVSLTDFTPFLNSSPQKPPQHSSSVSSSHMTRDPPAGSPSRPQVPTKAVAMFSQILMKANGATSQETNQPEGMPSSPKSAKKNENTPIIPPSISRESLKDLRTQSGAATATNTSAGPSSAQEKSRPPDMAISPHQTASVDTATPPTSARIPSRVIMIANRLPVNIVHKKPKPSKKQQAPKRLYGRSSLAQMQGHHSSSDSDGSSEAEPESEDASEDNLTDRPSEDGAYPSPTGPKAQAERTTRPSTAITISAASSGSYGPRKKRRSDAPADNYTFEMSSGGLVSAMNGLKGMEILKVGWPGTEIENEEDQNFITKTLKGNNCLPVFLSQHVADLYYNGFSNNILWPLFHYMEPDIDVIQGAEAQFDAYKKANEEFARVVAKELRPGDVVWVHDYHLFLLPRLLRALKPDITVGFFLHTPFPSSELYKVLPWRAELLHGVLSANLIGFHTHEYARHFISACTKVLGVQGIGEGVEFGGSVVPIGTFPIGISPERFIDALKTPAVLSHIKSFEETFEGKKVILGIDRLDYTKGLRHKLYAVERFLEKNPQFIGKIVLVQICVPTRTSVSKYQKLSRKVHMLAARINGRFGSVSSVPIHLLDQSIPFDKMCALYRVSDVLICSSVRDGMNLVAFEFLACQAEITDIDKAGVLILSEFAGAAQSLGAGAIRVNPWDVAQVADALRYALCMSKAERQEHHNYAIRFESRAIPVQCCFNAYKTINV